MIFENVRTHWVSFKYQVGYEWIYSPTQEIWYSLKKNTVISEKTLHLTHALECVKVTARLCTDYSVKFSLWIVKPSHFLLMAY